MPRYHFTIGLALTAATVWACARELPVVEVQGDCADAYGAQVCTWARMQGTAVTEVGLTLPVASIENAPDDQELTWPPAMTAALAMPEASQAEAGLTEITMYWEAHGHPPGPYLTPHFDFHFYAIPPAERLAMDCSDLTKPSVMPAGYTLPDVTLPPPMAEMAGVDTLYGLCVQQMGMHSLLTSELESTDTFRGSMVIGFYGGKPIFIEPMLTREMLLERRSFVLPIPSLPEMAGPHPQSFHAEYDAEEQVYRFVFSEFTPGA